MIGSWGVAFSYWRGTPVGFRIQRLGVYVKTPMICLAASLELISLSIACRVSGFGVRVSDFGFRVLCFGFWVSGCGFRVCPADSIGCRGVGFEVRGSGLGSRAAGLDFVPQTQWFVGVYTVTPSHASPPVVLRDYPQVDIPGVLVQICQLWREKGKPQKQMHCVGVMCQRVLRMCE